MRLASEKKRALSKTVLHPQTIPFYIISITSRSPLNTSLPCVEAHGDVGYEQLYHFYKHLSLKKTVRFGGRFNQLQNTRTSDAYPFDSFTKYDCGKFKENIHTEYSI
jgi:hypothetical protein